MIVDTSALVAVVAREPGWQQIVEALEASPSNALSAMALLELRIVLSLDRFGAGDAVDEYLARFRVNVVDFTATHAAVAADAYLEFGRARHPARLNFGDCASYATAKIAHESLLYVGDDFAQTDIPSALTS